MKKLQEIANGYMDLFISSKGKNLDFFMMYNNLNCLAKNIENINKIEIEEKIDLSL